MATTDTHYPKSSFLVNILNSFAHRTIITTDNQAKVNFISLNECQEFCDLPHMGDNLHENSLFSNEAMSSILDGVQEEEHVINREYNNKLGNLFHLKIIYTPIFTEDHQLEGLLIVIKDMTKEYEQSEKIKQQEKQYKTLFEYSTDAIIIHDLEGKISDVNRKSEAMFGIERDEFLTLYTEDLAYLKNQHEKRARLNKMLQEEGSAYFDCEFIRKDKTLFNGKVSSNLIETTDGEMLIQAIVSDVTAEQKAFRDLEKSNRQYEKLFENTAFGALIIDEENKRVLRCNTMASEILGIDKNNPTAWDTSILHTNLSHDEHTNHLYEVALNHSHSYSISIIDQEGQNRELLVSCRQVEFNDKPCHLSILVDITEKKNYQLELEETNKQLKKSEQNLLEAQEIAHIGNWEFDTVNNKITWSKEVYKIFGFEVNEVDPNYELFTGAIHPDDRERVTRAYYQSIETDLIYHVNYRIVTPKGETKYVEDRGKHLFDKQRKLVRSLGIVQDITKRTFIETELLNSRKKYQSIVDNMHDTYYRTNLKGELIYLSKGVEALSGYTIEELLGQNLANFYSNPSVREQFLRNLAQSNGEYSLQAELQHKNKNIIWMYSNSRYWYDEDGKVGGVEGFARDITQEKMALDALSQSEERWLLALEGAKHGVWDWKIQEEYVFFSRQWSAMLGYEEGQIENSFKSWLTLLHPDDLFRTLNAVRGYISGTKDKYQIQFRMLCQDGSYKWIQSQGAIWERDSEGEALRMVGTHSDITEMQQAQAKEKRLIELIESSSNEIYVFDQESLLFNYVNQGGINNLQYSAEELYTKHAYDITPDFTEKGFRDYIQPLIENSIQEQRFESTFERYDGSTYPVQIHLQLLDTQISTEFLAVVIDISEQTKMNQKIREQEEMMLVQSRHAAMGEMISMIAHQWRQPISIVGMLANTMKYAIESNKVDNATMKEDLQTIANQVQYMSKTIDDFRNFFQKSNAIEEVNLYDLLIEAKSILGAVLQRHNIQMTINCPIAITLSTYSRELVQVFINILSNAKDALGKVTDERGIIIDVVEQEETIKISIFNNGSPIEESIRHKIFEPYFTTKGNFGGTGLGLYMVKSILDKHMHGHIEVENRDNGVSFNITLPKILELE